MKYSTLVRASAAYDLVITSPFAVPGLAGAVLASLSTLNVALGGSPFAGFDTAPLLFVHLLGSIVTVWSVLRLLRPRWEFGVADAAGRALFSLHFALVLATSPAYPLVWVLLVPEALWGAAQVLGALFLDKTEV